MTIEVSVPIHAYTYGDGIGHSHTVEVIYLVRFLEPAEDVTLQPDEHIEARWVTREEADKLMRSSRPDARKLMERERIAVMAGLDALAKNNGKPQ